MNKNLFSFVKIFIILTIVLVILTGCNSKKSKNSYNGRNIDNSLDVNLDEIQINFETIISTIQVEFIKKESENPNADISEYITYEKFDNAMKEYNYEICLKDDINSKPTDMSELVINESEIYFTDKNNIFEITISKSDEMFDVITGSVELVK